MNQVPSSATYNVKAVVTETGLKPDTLRAWERRYGLPQPERSNGGHRLYSRRDVDTVLWLIARQEEGLSISHAVAMWEKLVVEGRDPLASAADHSRDEPDTSLSSALEAGHPIAELRQRWIAACLAFDEPRAQRVLDQAFALYAAESVCFEVLQKGLAEIGQGWYEGNITVQQEHFASALAIRRLDALIMGTPPPTRPGRILIGCPPEERHTFSPLFLALLLRRHGWDALYLGVNVPLEQMSQTLENSHADLLILSAQQLHTAASLLEVAESVAAQGRMLAYGGLVFNMLPQLRERVPGFFLGERLEETPRVVARLLTSRNSPEPVKSVPEDYRQALAAYGDQYPLIEATTWQTASELGMPAGQLSRANRSLSQNIIAALKFGDISLAGADMDWVSGLLFRRDVPPDLRRAYLSAYAEAAEARLDDRGRLVVDWLRSLLAASDRGGRRADAPPAMADRRHVRRRSAQNGAVNGAAR